MDSLNKDTIVKAILKGADYLINSQNSDGGLKHPDDSSTDSGIWVTAEALEFLLSSKYIPITAYTKIEPMINYLINTQNKDGSWAVLSGKGSQTKNEISSISTGHSVYVLKLAAANNYLYSKALSDAILNGELWLRKNCIEQDGYIFWEANPSGSSINPELNIGTRMEYVFSTFYAMYGLLNPYGYEENSDKDKDIIRKTKRFFLRESEFFIDKYINQIAEMPSAEFSKISSTICRLFNGLILLGETIPEKLHCGFEKIIRQFSTNPFMTSSITVHIEKLKGATATYNNNTPFDMAMSLVNLGVDANALKNIIDTYIEKQNNEGFWYLNFSDAYTVKTWATSEALLVLEYAMDKFYEMDAAEYRNKINLEITQLNDKISEIEKERDIVSENNKKIKKSSLVTNIISIVLSVLFVIAISLWLGLTPDKNKIIETILSIIIVPLSINIIWDVIKSIRNGRS